MHFQIYLQQYVFFRCILYVLTKLDQIQICHTNKRTWTKILSPMLQFFLNLTRQILLQPRLISNTPCTYKLSFSKISPPERLPRHQLWTSNIEQMEKTQVMCSIRNDQHVIWSEVILVRWMISTLILLLIAMYNYIIKIHHFRTDITLQQLASACTEEMLYSSS